MLSLRLRRAGVYGAELAEHLWSGELLERDLIPSTLQVSGPTRDLRYLWTAADGSPVLSSGCVLDDEDGPRFSGVLTNVYYDGHGQTRLTWDSDDLLFWERVVYPNPAAAWASQGTAYWTRTATPAETVGLDLIRAQLGASALAARQSLTSAAVPTSSGRGTSRTVKLRFDNVGQYLADLGDAEGLRWRVLDAASTGPVVTVVPVVDLSGSVVYSAGDSMTPGRLTDDWSVALSVSELTRALVAGGGTLDTRTLVERSDTDAETSWGRRVERLVEQTSTTATADLEKAGDDALTEGAHPVEIQGVVVTDATGLQLGSRVGLDLEGLQITDKVRTIRTVINRGARTVSAAIGSADAGLTQSQKDYLRLVRRLRKVPQ